MARFGSEYFQILHGEERHVGELTPTGGVAQRGTAFLRTDESTCGRGTGDLTGFLAQEIQALNPTIEELMFDKDLPVGIGEKVTLIVVEDGGEIAVEGEPDVEEYDEETLGLLVTTGTGAITAATAVGTDLSVVDGLWRVAQKGDRVKGILRSQMTPWVADTNIRILIELQRGGVVVA